MNLEEGLDLRTISGSEGVDGCRKRGVRGGSGALNMDELNHRGTCFPVDEDTKNFCHKEERR